jgi:hypothetical protein
MKALLSQDPTTWSETHPTTAEDKAAMAAGHGSTAPRRGSGHQGQQCSNPGVTKIKPTPSQNAERQAYNLGWRKKFHQVENECRSRRREIR